MTLDEATRLFQHGKFEEVIDLVDEYIHESTEDHSRFREFMLLKSRAYYHHGRIDQALYHVKEVLKIDEQDWLALTLSAIYQMDLGDIDSVETTINRLEEIEDQIDGIDTLAYYHYVTGMFQEYHGEFNMAKKSFEEALHFRLQIDDPYETNIVHYRLATLCRQIGDIPTATEHLTQSLGISKHLGLTKEAATVATLLGQDLLMRTKYEEALNLLDEGLDNWELENSPFGTIWALGELAIVQYLSGRRAEAVETYSRIINMAEDIVPPVYLSNHYLNIIRFCISDQNFGQAEEMLGRLEKLGQEHPIEMVTNRVKLAKSIYQIHTARISKIFVQKKQLKELSEAEEASIRLDSLRTSIELLHHEYRLTEKQLFKEEISREIEEKQEQLLSFVQLHQNITYELHSAALRAELDLLRYDPSSSREIIDLLSESDNRKEDLQLEDRFKQIENDQLQWTSKYFEFDKEFQSIPTLKILLYLLPRSWVSFSELQEGTGLSAGHLSGKTSRLEELGHIIKDKRFIDQKSTTVFSMSSTGFNTFRDYISELHSVFEKII